MAIARLALTDFRSWSELLLKPPPRLVILYGANGVGKTNILEAISLLVPGRGLRRAPLGEAARSGGPGGFAVAARLLGGDEIGIGTDAAAPERRQVRVNGAVATVTALADRIAALWLTPAMDRLFTEGASGRRRFLDRLVLALEPDHAANAARYEAAMRERNRLLADDDRAEATWIAGTEAIMAESGGAIAKARRRVTAALDEALARHADNLFASPEVTLEGWDGGEAPEVAMLPALRSARGRDAASGRSSIGPHRSDLLVRDRATGLPASHCSTGEQKSLLVSIVLAHADLVGARREIRPVLLLDEVAAHLDPVRRAALLERLAGSEGQTWLTTTELSLLDSAPRDALAAAFSVDALREASRGHRSASAADHL